MSHLLKVNAQEPDRQGDINSAAINDLSDVNISSPSLDQIIAWSGSAFEEATLLTPAGYRGHAGSTTSESSTAQSYPNPNLSGTDPNRWFWEYAALRQGGSDRMTVTKTSDLGSRYNTYGGGVTRWGVGVYFKTAGVYSLRATLHLGGFSSSSAYIDIAWTDINYNKLGPITRFARSDKKRNTLRGMVDASVNDVAGLYVVAESGSYYNRASYSNIFLEVERIA